MSDASPATTRNFPTQLGPLGGAIALWAALCAVAATEAGALIGSFIGFGAALLALPFSLFGVEASAAMIVASCLGLGVLTGILLVVSGIRRAGRNDMIIRGVHFIGFTAVVLFCMRGLAL